MAKSSNQKSISSLPLSRSKKSSQPHKREPNTLRLGFQTSNLLYIAILLFPKLALHEALISNTSWVKLSKFSLIDQTNLVPSRLFFTLMQASRCQHVFVDLPLLVLRLKLSKPTSIGFIAQTNKLSIPNYKDQTSKPSCMAR